MIEKREFEPPRAGLIPFSKFSRSRAFQFWSKRVINRWVPRLEYLTALSQAETFRFDQRNALTI